MATGENVLWCVMQLGGKRNKVWVFRTRDAARRFEADKNKRSKTALFIVYRATWGPEQ